MLRILYLLIILIFLSSCSRIETLNQSFHRYGISPKRIIWFQIPGFSEDHIAMLRFNLLAADQKTSFEKFSCVGKAWGYNIFDLRPSAVNGLVAQIVGKENVTGSCKDFRYDPIWNYLGPLGYKVGVLESGANNAETFDYNVKCKNTVTTFLDQTIFWRMSKSKDKNPVLFHYQEKSSFDENGIYYDRSCQKGRCYASLTSNIYSLFERFRVDRGKYLMIVRDFSYFHALKNKKIAEARTVLDEIDQILSKFLEIQKNDDEMLLIVSSSAAHGLDFPKAGKQWAYFEKSGKHLGYRSSLLLSPVMAIGAGAENFCGVYKESDIFLRLLHSQQVKRKFKLF